MTKRPVDEAIRAFYDTLDADKTAEASMEGAEPMEEPDDDEPPTLGRDEFMEELAKAKIALTIPTQTTLVENSRTAWV